MGVGGLAAMPVTRSTTVLLLVAMCEVRAQQTQANLLPDSNIQSQAIRDYIFNREGFSKIVPPTSNRTATIDPAVLGGTSDTGVRWQTTHAGTDVGVQIRFFKVQRVEPADGSMTLKVWFRMSWVDTRLAWDPANFSGVDMTYFQGTMLSGGEDNEIWIPDIQPYNGVHGLVETLEPSLVTVYHDGSTFFSRPGSLIIMCKFSGLVAFPFDTLQCPVEFGGWAFSGLQQGINLHNGGYAFENQEDTSGTSYQEYTIASIAVDKDTFEYNCCPGEPWPIIRYTIRMNRSSDFYVTLCIIPGITITLLSFAVFWADTASADALGFGIGVIVVNILATVVVMDLLPICGELIWIDIFSLVNTGFCCLALFQTTFNIMLEHMQSDTLLPLWVIIPAKALLRKVRALTSSLPDDEQSSNPDVVLASASSIHESVAGVIFRASLPKGEDLEEESIRTTRKKQEVRMTDTPPDERARKLIFFERLFFMLDEDSSMFIEREECDSLLSYAKLELSPVDRVQKMAQFDTNSDEKLNRVEFCRLCAAELWDVDINLLEMAVENMRNARGCKKNRNRNKWNRTADRADSWARIIIPFLYFLALIWVFALDLTDDYATDATAPMFKGLGPNRITENGRVALTVYLCICLAIFILWLVVNNAAKVEKKREEAQFAIAGARASLLAEAATGKFVEGAHNLKSKAGRGFAFANEFMQGCGFRRPSSEISSHTGRSAAVGGQIQDPDGTVKAMRPRHVISSTNVEIVHS